MWIIIIHNDSDLSSAARNHIGISGRAQSSCLSHVIRDPEHLTAVPGKQLQRFPGLTEVPRAFQHHSSRPRRAERHHNMTQTEPLLQVQADFFLFSGGHWGSPPGIWMEKRVIGHHGRRMEICHAAWVGWQARRVEKREEGPATGQVTHRRAAGAINTSGLCEKQPREKRWALYEKNEMTFSDKVLYITVITLQFWHVTMY